MWRSRWTRSVEGSTNHSPSRNPTLERLLEGKVLISHESIVHAPERSSPREPSARAAPRWGLTSRALVRWQSLRRLSPLLMQI